MAYWVSKHWSIGEKKSEADASFLLHFHSIGVGKKGDGQ